MRPALLFKRLLAGARGADRRTRQWRLDIPGGDNGGRDRGGIGGSEDDLVECSRGYADGAGGASNLGVRGHGSSQVSGVLATGLVWLCRHLPIKGKRGGGRAGRSGEAVVGLAAGWMRSVPFSGSSPERLAGCSTCWGGWEGWGAGAGRLEGVCLQMDNETGWMTATHTLPPFSVVWTQKPRQRSPGEARPGAPTGHAHAGDKGEAPGAEQRQARADQGVQKQGSLP